jgi:cleavage and polyadenylation specificity factor subunit 3
MLQDMFGEESVPKIFQGDRIYVSVDNKRANVDLSELKVIKSSDSNI